jgi:hypothetical protein
MATKYATLNIVVPFGETELATVCSSSSLIAAWQPIEFNDEVCCENCTTQI